MQARGRLGKMKKFESTSIVCLRRHFPRTGKPGMRVEYKAAF